jgi:hypothetical protein
MTDTAASLREALDDLLASLDAARARQWETSPVPRPRDDTTERSKGEAPSDPTADTVLDARRLAVRKEVQLAEGVLEVALRAFARRRDELDRAVRRFDGA